MMRAVTDDRHRQLGSPLPASFYGRAVERVARDLLGCHMVRRTARGIRVAEIVETEAYLAAGDPACHGARGPTRRNRSMFGAAGRAYVYAIHSRWCFNVVCESPGVPAAVLIRAARPIFGVEWMQAERGACRELDLLRGPARLCEGLNIDKRLDGWRLDRPTRLWLTEPRQRGDFEIATSPRIGVTSAHDLPLRFFIDGSRFVSGPRKYHSCPVH